MSLSFKKQKDKRVKIKKKVAAFQINQKKKKFFGLWRRDYASKDSGTIFTGFNPGFEFSTANAVHLQSM